MNTRRNVRALVLLGLAAAFTFTACTPEQQDLFRRAVAEEQAKDRFRGAVSDAGLARLRACESGGNYGIVSSNGLYRGAYQFSTATWNATAGRHYPHLRGVDPAKAAPADQDRMARALWATGGPQNWPVCSRRV
jgi:hypothetical protein